MINLKNTKVISKIAEIFNDHIFSDEKHYDILLNTLGIARMIELVYRCFDIVYNKKPMSYALKGLPKHINTEAIEDLILDISNYYSNNCKICHSNTCPLYSETCDNCKAYLNESHQYNNKKAEDDSPLTSLISYFSHLEQIIEDNNESKLKKQPLESRDFKFKKEIINNFYDFNSYEELNQFAKSNILAIEENIIDNDNHNIYNLCFFTKEDRDKAKNILKSNYKKGDEFNYDN